MTNRDSTLILTTPCSICLHALPTDEFEQCSECGERICESCPAFGCLCVDNDSTIQALRVEIRSSAIEFACLRAEREFMGADSLTIDQQSRWRLLSDVVGSLRAEVNRLDEIRGGEVYQDEV